MSSKESQSPPDAEPNRLEAGGNASPFATIDFLQTVGAVGRQALASAARPNLIHTRRMEAGREYYVVDRVILNWYSVPEEPSCPIFCDCGHTFTLTPDFSNVNFFCNHCDKIYADLPDWEILREGDI